MSIPFRSEVPGAFVGASPFNAPSLSGADTQSQPQPEALPQTPPINTLPMESNTPDTFAPFIAPGATDIPSKWQFFRDELKANLGSTMKEGTEQYKEALKEDKYTQFKTLLIMLSTGVGLTIFRHLRRTATFVLLMAILGKPLMIATQAFPKMEEAYEKVKSGNPTEGQAEFREALDESFYTIFMDQLRPVSFGIILSYLLEAPFILRGHGQEMRHNVTRFIARILHVKGDALPIRKAFDAMRPAVDWGDRQSARVRRKIPIIGWIEDPTRLSELAKHTRQLMRRAI